MVDTAAWEHFMKHADQSSLDSLVSNWQANTRKDIKAGIPELDIMIPCAQALRSRSS
jgi:hypothetical protein